MAVDDNARVLPVALLGADALLAARPFSPVQLAHACLAAGFEAAYPATWGDELIAANCLSQLESRERRPLALGACPLARRATEASGWPADTLVVAAPPVAAARLIRAAYPSRPVKITYIGACPSGSDEVFDEQLRPEIFLASLRERGIALAEQPESYESVLPPDRRRYFSDPGGAPAQQKLAALGWTSAGLASLKSPVPGTLADPAPDVGCVCSGAPLGRSAIVATEPPRAAAPVLDPLIVVDLTPEALPEAAGKSAAPPLAPAPVPEIVSEPVSEPVCEPTSEPVSEPVPEPVPALVSEPVPELVHETVPTTDAGPPGAAIPPLGARRPMSHGQSRRQDAAWAEPVLPRRIDEVRPRPRFSIVTLLLAAALGLALPFAVTGGWLLYRDGLGVLRDDREFPTPSPMSPPPSATPALPQPADSTKAVASDSTPRDSVQHVEPPITGAAAARGDSATRSDSAAGAVDTQGVAPRATRRAPTTSRRAPPARTAAPSRPVVRPGATGGAESARAGGGAHPLQTATTDTAAEAAALRAEIARRRARMDSLARVVDSLSRVRRPPSRPFR